MIQAWKNADKSANFDAPVAGVSVNEAAMMTTVTGGGVRTFDSYCKSWLIDYLSDLF